jgi:hypothetical protein
MNKKEYGGLFCGDTPHEGQKKSKAEMALEFAMDIRKFEIELC